LPALKGAAADPDELIAEHAAWAIERIQARSKMQASKVCWIQIAGSLHLIVDPVNRFALQRSKLR